MAGKGQITGKYGKKLVERWNDMENLENTEENSEKMKNMEERQVE
jgi:hypothetical protein